MKFKTLHFLNWFQQRPALASLCSFHRLENEHLNNAGKFRAVKAVPLPFRDMNSEE